MLGGKNIREQCFLTAALQSIKHLVAFLLRLFKAGALSFEKTPALLMGLALECEVLFLYMP